VRPSAHITMSPFCEASFISIRTIGLRIEASQSLVVWIIAYRTSVLRPRPVAGFGNSLGFHQSHPIPSAISESR
jgi:hypothetical protein